MLGDKRLFSLEVQQLFFTVVLKKQYNYCIINSVSVLPIGINENHIIAKILGGVLTPTALHACMMSKQ